MTSVAAPQPQTSTDFAALAELRARAAQDAGAVTPEAARQFEALFVQMTLGDDRAIRQTWIAGRKAWDRDEAAGAARRL